MEKALRYEIGQNEERLRNRIFPTNAPEGKSAPYLVYIRERFLQLKVLEGFKKRYETSYLLNIFSDKYEEMEDLAWNVKEIVIGFLKREIGQEGVFVEDVTLRNMIATFEPQLNLYRGVIDIIFVYTKEE